MAFSNRVMVELMVPREPETARRIDGFYRDIGWFTRQKSGSDANTTYVQPIRGEAAPVIMYWQTANLEKIRNFYRSDEPTPSEYAVGRRLSKLNDLVEVSLILPHDESVTNVFQRGGSLLVSHVHVPLREHAGAREFRFADPFNYSLRVTADPGYEIQPLPN